MHLIKLIMTGAAAALFTSLFVNAPAAELSASRYAEVLKGNEAEASLMDAEIYNAIYNALTETLSDEEAAPAKSSLSADLLMTKMQSTLSQSPSSVEEYGTPRITLQNNDGSVDGLNTDVPETSAAETESGNPATNNSRISLQANSSSLTNAESKESVSAGSTDASPANAADTAGAKTPASANNPDAGAAGSKESAPAGSKESVPADSKESAPAGNKESAPADNTGSAPASTPEDSGSKESVPAAPDNPPATAVLDAGSTEDTAPAADTSSSKNYHHTTSIYTDDESTLLRVEYYDDNNKLVEYSSVSNYDKDTNSYTETVYKWDYENDVQVTTRTDTYVNGELTSSENP